MKKITAIALILVLFVSGNANFIYAGQQNQPQKLTEYKYRFDTDDKPVFIQAGFNPRNPWNRVLDVLVLGFGGYLLYKQNKNKIINKEKYDLIDFLKFEKHSEAMGAIDDVTKSLGADVDMQIYAEARTDAYEISRMLHRGGIDSRNLEQFYDYYYRNRGNFADLVSIKNNAKGLRNAVYLSNNTPTYSPLEVYRDYREQVIKEYFQTAKENNISLEGLILSKTGKQTIRDTVLKRTLVLAAVLLVVSGLSAKTQDKIKQIALNQDLAFEADDQTLDAIDDLKDGTLKKALVENFDNTHKAAAQLKNMTPYEQKDLVSSANQYQKEQNKTPVFDRRDMKNKQLEISQKYGMENLRVAK